MPHTYNALIQICTNKKIILEDDSWGCFETELCSNLWKCEICDLQINLKNLWICYLWPGTHKKFADLQQFNEPKNLRISNLQALKKSLLAHFWTLVIYASLVVLTVGLSMHQNLSRNLWLGWNMEHGREGPWILLCKYPSSMMFKSVVQSSGTKTKCKYFFGGKQPNFCRL